MKVGDQVEVVKIDKKRHLCIDCLVKRIHVKDPGTGKVRIEKVSRGNIVGKKGRVRQLLINSRGVLQGARVRFPGGWEYPFYLNELEVRK